jgi:hypothetical protein
MQFGNDTSDSNAASWLLDSLYSWAILVEGHRFKSRFSILASVFGDRLVELRNLDLKDFVDTKIARLKEELSVGIEDYGTWRATRGNPSYDVYVAARQGSSAELARLTLIAAHLPDLTNAVEDLVRRLGSIENLAKASRSYRAVHDLAINESVPAEIYGASKLGSDDISLCLVWAGYQVRPATTEDAVRLIQNELSNYDACRLLSARAAELAVMAYYRNLGFDVEDISIRQIEGKDARWKDFDLLAGEYSLDVKNARSSFTSPDAYVEHCVPRFKLNRDTQTDVSVVGVLSAYIAEPESIVDGTEKCQVLGQVNVTEIRQVYRWMRRRFGMTLNLDGVWNPGFLPGWIFDYPDQQYESRKALRTAVRQLLDSFHEARDSVSDLPGWLLGLEPTHPIIDILKLSHHCQIVLRDLAALDDGVGIRRYSVYLYSMGFLLEAMLDESDGGLAFDALQDIIFTGSTQTKPLGLIDAQAYVSSLVRMLKEVHAEAKRKQLKFKAFQMPHPGILKGQLQDGYWMTLIAYCGGWIEEPFKVKCGASPLFFGEHENCPACGRLVCSACGFCSEGCDLYYQRKAKLAHVREEHYYDSSEDDDQNIPF